MDHSQYVKTYKLPSEMAGHRLLSLVILSFTGKFEINFVFTKRTHIYL